MSRKQKALDYAVAEVCRLLDVFGERFWRFTVEYDKELDSVAQVFTSRTLNQFCLTVGPLFLAESPKDRANTILHEVLHVLQRNWFHLVHFTLDQSSLPEGERKMFQSLFTDAHEVYTDKMAGVLAGKV